MKRSGAAMLCIGGLALAGLSGVVFAAGAPTASPSAPGAASPSADAAAQSPSGVLKPCGELTEEKLGACWKEAVADLRNPENANKTFDLTLNVDACPASATPTAKVKAGTSETDLPASCSDQALHILVSGLRVPSAGAVSISVSHNGKSVKATAGADQPDAGAEASTSTGDAGPKSVDIPPRVCGFDANDKCDAGGKGDGEKLIVVDENLAIRGQSELFVTEGDRIVVRFLVRKALACRMFAFPDDSDKYEPQPIRVGGSTGLDDVKAWLKTGAGADEKKSAEEGGPPVIKSCNEDIVPESIGEDLYQYRPKSNDYVPVDYRFGPFTTDSVVIHLIRRDRGLLGTDMQSEIRIPNHKLYSGWFDITLGLNLLAHGSQEAKAIPASGTQISRLQVSEKQSDYDIGIMLRAYTKCDEGQGGWFRRVDFEAANVCLGFATGLSLAHPMKTFYPIGVSLSLGRFFTFHAMYSLNLVERVPASYSSNQVYSGDPNGIPTTTHLDSGLGLAIGIDPGLFATMVKGIATGR